MVNVEDCFLSIMYSRHQLHQEVNLLAWKLYKLWSFEALTFSLFLKLPQNPKQHQKAQDCKITMYLQY